MVAEMVAKECITNTISPIAEVVTNKEEEAVDVVTKEVACKEVDICSLTCKCLTNNTNNLPSDNNNQVECHSPSRCNKIR